MSRRVAVVYNAPEPSRYDLAGETKAVAGVLEAVAAVRDSLELSGDDVDMVPLFPPWSESRARLAALRSRVTSSLEASDRISSASSSLADFAASAWSSR